jgi:hypothetical protein
VEQAIDFLLAKSGESGVEYSFGMSEAARAKFSTADSLTDRLKSRGQWTGTCSDFVQLGIEDLDAHTIVSLMIISAGDEKRQIRERIFSQDKNVVGVAIGHYKQSTAVAVTLATKFVSNGPTEELERATRGGRGGAAEAHVRNKTGKGSKVFLMFVFLFDRACLHTITAPIHCRRLTQ